MEKLLHYVWKHRLFPLGPLTTTDGERIEVLDPGLWNHNAGPDFFNAKLCIGGQEWVGNVEMHLRSSDWQRHGHQSDAAYENVVLHVVAEADTSAFTPSGRRLPQLVLPVPPEVEGNFRQLMEVESYPPCYKVIPGIPVVKVHAWMSALTVERLECKTQRIMHYLSLTANDWERCFFIALARALAFGVNSEAFEQWALQVDLTKVGKHRDQLEQVVAYFLGTAGLLSRLEQRDDYAVLCREWHFLQAKFGIGEVGNVQWKYLRMRPQNFPHVRLLQLAEVYHEGRISLSHLLSAPSSEAIRALFREAMPHISAAMLDLLLINMVAPLLFAYGQSHANEELADRAFQLLEDIKAEKNYITRCWEHAGLHVNSAADSQALIQLRTQYCDRRDCLRCRFGAEYLRSIIP